jgi:hypothetical protein
MLLNAIQLNILRQWADFLSYPAARTIILVKFAAPPFVSQKL